MPTATQLIAIVSEAIGQEPASVNTRYRRLRETGMIGVGGRGHNALTLRLFDAARVLVACLASGEARDAPITVQALDNLKLRRVQQIPREKKNVGFDHVLKASFFDELCINSTIETHELSSSLNDMLQALSEHRLTPLPEVEAFEQLTAGRPPRRQSGSGLPYARVEMNAIRHGLDIRVEEAVLAFGRQKLYSVNLTFGAKSKLVDAKGTIQERRSVGLGALKHITSITWD